MIIYDFCCAQSHCFEGWFSNRDDYKDQLAKDIIRCPVCDTPSVQLQPPAPAIHVEKRTQQLDRAKKQKKIPARPPNTPKPVTATKTPEPMTALRTLTQMLRTKLEETCENVGPKFTQEAIAIHCGEAEERDIMGTATTEDLEDLDELDVPYQKLHIPHFDD